MTESSNGDSGRVGDRFGGAGTARSPMGDQRWTGATTIDLLGQRAQQRSPGTVDDAVVSVGDDESVMLPELPDLESDLYLLEPDMEGARDRRQAILSSLHGLALDKALSNGGDVIWIDAQGHATTHTLSSVAPSDRALERVHLARAFTTHQHHTLVEELSQWFRGEAASPFGEPDTDRPAVVICPALDVLYRDGEMGTSTAKELFVRAVATLRSIVREYDVPIIASRARESAFSEPLTRAATEIVLEWTAFGPKFECDALDFETVVYETDSGLLQTTFAFWQEVLSARHGTTEESETRQGGRRGLVSSTPDERGPETQLRIDGGH